MYFGILEEKSINQLVTLQSMNNYISFPYIRIGIGIIILILCFLLIHYAKKWKVEMSKKDYLGLFFVFCLCEFVF